MDLEKAMGPGTGKAQVRKVAAWIADDRRKFAELIALVLAGSPVAARAAWVMGDCVEAHPRLLAAHLGKLLDCLERQEVPQAVMRNVFRVLQFAPLSGRWENRVMSLAMAALAGAAPVAVKAYAMTIIQRLAAASPAILELAKLHIQEQLPGASAAFRARARLVFGIR